MKAVILSIMLTLILSCCKNPAEEEESNFLNQALKGELLLNIRDKMDYRNDYAVFKTERMYSELKKDTIYGFSNFVMVLTQREKQDIIRNLEPKNYEYWLGKLVNPNNLEEKMKIEPNDKIGWVITKPVFMRDYTYCAFGYSYFYGSESGESSYCIYKQTNGKWNKILTIDGWTL